MLHFFCWRRKGEGKNAILIAVAADPIMHRQHLSRKNGKEGGGKVEAKLYLLGGGRGGKPRCRRKEGGKGKWHIKIVLTMTNLPTVQKKCDTALEVSKCYVGQTLQVLVKSARHHICYIKLVSLCLWAMAGRSLWKEGRWEGALHKKKSQVGWWGGGGGGRGEGK